MPIGERNFNDESEDLSGLVIRENGNNSHDSLSPEEIDTINGLRRRIEEELVETEDRPLRQGTIFTSEEIGERNYPNTDDEEVSYFKSEKWEENHLEKRCTFIQIESTDIINVDEPHFSRGQWRTLKINFKKKMTPYLLEYKDEKDFDYIIDVFEDKNYLYRWVIECESIVEIDFTKEEFVSVLVNPKNCLIIKE